MVMDETKVDAPDENPSGAATAGDQPRAASLTDKLHKLETTVEEMEAFARSLKAEKRRSEFRVV